MMLAHHGYHVPMEEIRRITGVSRDCLNASDIVRCGRSLGFRCSGHRVELHALREEPTPFIAHVNFIHFVVVEEIRDNVALVNDPAAGRVEMELDHLDEIFTGIVVRFRPGDGDASRTTVRPDIGGRPASGTGFVGLWRRARGLIRILAVLALLVPAVEAVVLAWVAASLIGTGHATIGNAATAVSGTMLAALLVLLAVGFIRILSCAALEERASRCERAALIDLLLSRSYFFLNYRLPGDMFRVAEGVGLLLRGLVGDVLPALASMPAIAILIAAILSFDPIRGGVIAAIVTAMAGILLIANTRLSRRMRKSRESVDPDLMQLARSLENIEVNKTGGRDEDFVANNLGSLATRLSTEHSNTVRLIVETTILTVGGALVVLVAGTAALISGATATESVSMLLLAGATALYAGRWRGAVVASDIARHGLMLADDLRESAGIDDRLRPSRVGEGQAVPVPGMALQVRNVTFGHSETRPPLFRELDLDIPTGSQVGISGPSGGGKSSFGALVAGLHVPWSGEIVSPVAEGGSTGVAWVDKSTFLFAGSLRDNLVLFDGSVGEEALHAALDAVALSEVVAGRDGGVDCHVETRGRNFSGGQCQRIEIARAILRRPAVIVLDEALDALNPALERLVRKNLRSLGIALLIISHRASTLEACDILHELRDGRLRPVGETGTKTVPATGIRPAAIPAPVPGAGAVASRHLDELFAGLAGTPVDLSKGAVGVVPETGDPVADAARRSGFLVRPVRFQLPRWWGMAVTPFIGSWRMTGRPVTVVPRTNRYALPGAGDVAVEDVLSGRGHAVYRRETLDDRTLAGLLRVPGRNLVADALRAGACAGGILLIVALVPWLITNAMAQATSGFRIGLSLAGLVLVLGLVAAALLIAVSRLETRIEFQAMGRIFQLLARIGPSHVRKTGSESFGRGLAAIGRLFDLLRGHLSNLVPLAAILFGGVIALFAAGGWRTGLLALAFLAVGPVTSLAVARCNLGPSREVFAGRLRSRRFLLDMLRGIGRLRSLRADRNAGSAWLAQQLAQDRTERGINRISDSAGLVVQLSIWGGAIGFPVLAGSSGDHHPAVIASMLWLCLLTLPPVAAAIRSSGDTLAFVPDLRRLLGSPLESRGDLPSPGTGISARGLVFAHVAGGSPAVRNLSIEIEPGRILAIAGPSGSGKSTLVRLLLGLEIPDRGTITIGGKPFCEIDPLFWRYRVGMVLQGDRIEQASTLRSHITGFGRYELADAERAAALAELSDAIAAMPMGMQTILERDKFSTGQEQRLLLARELVRNPSLLVLDEATNAIPDNVQSRIFAAIRALGITCILVTHRESALLEADRIVVLEEGTVTWTGTGSDLMQRDDLRAMLAMDRLVEEEE